MILYLDTETTGLYPGQICQLSYIMQTKDKTVAKNFFFSVDFVEPSAQMVHGFSAELLEKLSNGKCFGAFLSEIESDFNNANCIVSHNTSFDFMFLKKEFERENSEFIANNSFCSMKNTVALCKLPRKNSKGYKYPKLAELCTFLGVSELDIERASKSLYGSNFSFHDARFDTVALYLAVNKGINSHKEFTSLKEYL
ncbi:MAG: 3'-5' exonuclease [Clostridia bacterium]|nr:3'-5' exonuclease [Clostridia bacterium]